MQDNSKYFRYVILINRKNKYTLDVIKKHVEHLNKLDKNGQLVLCGPFKDYDGGIVILKAKSMEAAKMIVESDPFISEGFSNYKLRTLELSCKENKHLGMG